MAQDWLLSGEVEAGEVKYRLEEGLQGQEQEQELPVSSMLSGEEPQRDQQPESKRKVLSIEGRQLTEPLQLD